MERMWAPWRIEYIMQPKTDKCILCEIPRDDRKRDRDNLLLHRGEKAFILMNKYPYNNGHLMIAPYRHIPTPIELEQDEVLEMHMLLKLSIKTLDKVMKPHGYNIGANLGRAAGAGIEEHYHVHIVPRWVGDTNFMPILANTKVMVEYLLDTYDKLKKGMNEVIKDVLKD